MSDLASKVAARWAVGAVSTGLAEIVAAVKRDIPKLKGAIQRRLRSADVNVTLQLIPRLDRLEVTWDITEAETYRMMVISFSLDESVITVAGYFDFLEDLSAKPVRGKFQEATLDKLLVMTVKVIDSVLDAAGL